MNALPDVDIGSIGGVSLTFPSIEAIPCIPNDISGVIPLQHHGARR
jgi:hypothetical protein